MAEGINKQWTGAEDEAHYSGEEKGLKSTLRASDIGIDIGEPGQSAESSVADGDANSDEADLNDKVCRKKRPKLSDRGDTSGDEESSDLDDDLDDDETDPSAEIYRKNMENLSVNDDQSELSGTTNPVLKLNISLIDAVKKNDSKKVEKLIKRGAHVDFEYENKSALCYTVECGSTDIVKLLLKAGAKVQKSSNPEVRNTCPMHRAAMLGHLDIIKILVEHGVNVNILEREQGTALHAAASRERPDIVKYLVEKGAAINLAQTDGTTALCLGACSGNVEICEYLLKHGAEVNRVDKEGWGSLHNASCFNHLPLIDVLVKYGANVDQLSSDHETPLHAAVQADRSDVVRRLFHHGANLNIPNVHGHTALYESVSRHYTLTGWTLLDVGVDMNSPTNTGAFSDAIIGLELHEKIDLKMVIQLLLEAGCKIRADWLLKLGNTVLVHRCISLNRLYRHLTNPRTLQALCIMVIRDAIKKPISENVKLLGIPVKLEDPICLRDFIKYASPGLRWGWGGGNFKE